MKSINNQKIFYKISKNPLTLHSDYYSWETWNLKRRVDFFFIFLAFFAVKTFKTTITINYLITCGYINNGIWNHFTSIFQCGYTSLPFIVCSMSVRLWICFISSQNNWPTVHSIILWNKHHLPYLTALCIYTTMIEPHMGLLAIEYLVWFRW